MMRHLQAQQGAGFRRAGPGRWWETDADLLAYYPFGSSNSWNDQSGNGYNLTASGAAEINATGAVRSAVFSGGYASTAGAVSNGTSYTLMLWVRFASVTGTQMLANDRSSVDLTAGEYQMALASSAVLSNVIFTDNSLVQPDATPTLSTNTWYCLGLTCNAATTTVRAYYAGSQVGADVSFAGKTPRTNSAKFRLAASSWAGGLLMSGRINDVVVVDRAATPAEMAAYYDETRAYYA